MTTSKFKPPCCLDHNMFLDLCSVFELNNEATPLFKPLFFRPNGRSYYRSWFYFTAELSKTFIIIPLFGLKKSGLIKRVVS